MAIVTKTSTVTPVVLPLACDPVVADANPCPKDGPWALAIYRETSDRYHPAAPLVVPADATLVRLRPLSRREVERCAAAGGERSTADAAVFAEAAEELGFMLAAGVHGAADRVVAKLEPEKRAAYQRHEAWLLAQSVALARASLVSISDLPHLVRGDDGYPIEALQAMDGATDADDLRWPPGLDSSAILWEVGRHAERISRLGKAGRPSSGLPSGSPTTSASGGSATALDSAAGTCPATGGCPS